MLHDRGPGRADASHRGILPQVRGRRPTAEIGLMAGGTAYAASSTSAATADSVSSTTIYGCYDSGGDLKVILPLGARRARRVTRR